MHVLGGHLISKTPIVFFGCLRKGSGNLVTAAAQSWTMIADYHRESPTGGLSPSIARESSKLLFFP